MSMHEHEVMVLTPNELRRIRWNLGEIIDGDLPLGDWLIKHGAVVRVEQQAESEPELTEPAAIDERAVVTEVDRELAEGRGDPLILAWAQLYREDGIPDWVSDDALWQRAKDLVSEAGEYVGSTYWAVVGHTYVKLG